MDGKDSQSEATVPVFMQSVIVIEETLAESRGIAGYVVVTTDGDMQ
jgi:hypothetical protein